MALFPQQPLFPPPVEKTVDKLRVTLEKSWSGDTEIKLSRSNNQSLKIAFERTLRVPDNGKLSDLPPTFGNFPLLEVKDYADRLPEHMAAKGGFFFPMYKREAMWISLSSQKPFAIKIYVGGINAVSGEPAVETELTIKRRVTLLNNSKPVQDYVVTPDQHWLDGIASEDGNVRQFVAVPTGSGYSVEAQITGHDHIAGLQFEVTPVHKPVRRERKPGDVKIFIKPFWGETIPFWCSKSEGIGPIEEMIKERFGIPPQLQRFSVHPEDQHHDHPDAKKTTYRFSGYDISEGVVVRFREELIGGGGYSHEMTIGAGGKIRQTIRPDTNSPSIWDIDSTTTFNVQILNSATYQSVTGKPPPVSSITYASYAKHGYPFYAFYNEMPTDIKGDFTGVKSVNDLDSAGKQTDEKVRASAEVNESLHGPVVLLDMNGRRRGFRPVSELEKEVKSVRSFFSGL